LHRNVKSIISLLPSLMKLRKNSLFSTKITVSR
jgi:hypothetical protein